MLSSKYFDGFVAVSPSEFFAADTAAGSVQSRKLGFQKLRIGQVLPITGRKEVLQADIEAGRRIDVGQLRIVRQLTDHDQKPLIGLPLESQRLNRSFYQPVQTDADTADMLNAQPIPSQADSIAVAGKLDRFESVSSLETRITGLLSRLETSKEISESLVQTAQRSLSAGEVNSAEPGIFSPLRFVPGRLFGVLDADLKRLPGILSLGQGCVVEPAVGLEHDRELALLISVSPEPEFKAFLATR